MIYITPWCEQERLFSIRDAKFVFESTYRSFTGRAFFCVKGLKEWVIPKGIKVRLHISSVYVRGAQRSIYRNSKSEYMLNYALIRKGFYDSDTVWWWPEIREWK